MGNEVELRIGDIDDVGDSTIEVLAALVLQNWDCVDDATKDRFKNEFDPDDGAFSTLFYLSASDTQRTYYTEGSAVEVLGARPLVKAVYSHKYKVLVLELRVAGLVSGIRDSLSLEYIVEYVDNAQDAHMNAMNWATEKKVEWELKAHNESVKTKLEQEKS